MTKLRDALAARGLHVTTVDLVPNDGRATIATLGAFLARESDVLRARASVTKIDVVGFSMGALVARWFVQRGGGKKLVRRFVSVSGPHAGTLTAHALPFAGARDMRPGSALLRDLASDPDPFGPVETHCLYTPFDLMILPARSSVLPHARTTSALPVALHRWMITDARVATRIADLLLA